MSRRSGLVVDSLMHSFGLNDVLSGVYLRVAPGEIVGILGRNGSGKTTILRSITGELEAHSMHLSIDGEVITRGYRSGKLAHLAQEPFLPRRLSVRRCVRVFVPERNAAARILADERVRPLAGQRAGALSGGEKRYVEALMILALDAPYLLLDEPFTEVEPRYREPLKERIREASLDRGFLITDHAYRDVVDVSTRLLVLADGVVHEVGGEHDLTRLGYTP